MSKGAGGTSGGIGQFFIGLIMLCSGFFLLLNAITVSSGFGMGSGLYHFSMFGSRVGITTGMVLVPFIFGIGLVFYNAKNVLGWLLTIGSISAMLFGVITSISFHMRPMSAFDLITILVLAVGGLGLFLRSLKSIDQNY